MENNIKFRNHISIIFESTVRAVWALVFVFIGSFLSDVDTINETQNALDVWIFVGVFVVVLLVCIIWQYVVWAKTYVSIQENTLVVERNTWNRKKNTIGIKNISNVNLEQNLLEMLFGTCKVKLDTNSLSTANETDVKIVLKKKDAEKFREFLVQKTEAEWAVHTEEDVCEEKKFISDMDDIVMHGLFSINIISVVILVVAIVAAVFVWNDTLHNKRGIMEVLITVFMIFWFLGERLWSIINGFIKYLDFEIERKGDKIFLSYGLLKKVTYSIPVDKINAVRFTQTMIARLGRRYMVEIINVGMDDDENETNSFFLPYAKREKLERQIKMLLPEFADCLEIREERQPSCIWLIWLPALVLYLIIMGTGCAILVNYVPEMKVEAIVAIIVLGLIVLVVKTAEYFTIGCIAHEHFLKIVSGCFGKRSLYVKYDKIQFVTIKQNVLAKQFHVQKGNIHLLAAIKNQVHILPYFSEEDVERLKGKLR